MVLVGFDRLCADDVVQYSTFYYFVRVALRRRFARSYTYCDGIYFSILYCDKNTYYSGFAVDYGRIDFVRLILRVDMVRSETIDIMIILLPIFFRSFNFRVASSDVEIVLPESIDSIC